MAAFSISRCLSGAARTSSASTPQRCTFEKSPYGYLYLGILWELIAQQQDQMVKYATALRPGTAESESILRRFTRGGPGYRSSSSGTPATRFYGKDGDLTGPDREHAEVSMLALHLRQAALVHINTLLLQAVLEVPEFHDSIGDDERRALTPLFWSHVNPYGRFRLNMDTHLDLSGSSTGTGGVESVL